MMYEKIDALRSLLELPDRDIVSVVTLYGSAEYPNDRAGRLEHVRTGDVAFVFVGPEDLLPGTITNHEDGSVTFTLKVERE